MLYNEGVKRRLKKVKIKKEAVSPMGIEEQSNIGAMPVALCRAL